MKVIINLTGWADSFTTGDKKLDFVLQLAMYEVVGNCDWNFKVKTKGKSGFVYDPYNIAVIATRCYSVGYDNKKETDRHFEEYCFKFDVPSYTKANVYKYAKEAIKQSSIK